MLKWNPAQEFEIGQRHQVVRVESDLQTDSFGNDDSPVEALAQSLEHDHRKVWEKHSKNFGFLCVLAETRFRKRMEKLEQNNKITRFLAYTRGSGDQSMVVFSPVFFRDFFFHTTGVSCRSCTFPPLDGAVVGLSTFGTFLLPLVNALQLRV